jgi:hypothetical protein
VDDGGDGDNEVVFNGIQLGGTLEQLTLLTKCIDIVRDQKMFMLRRIGFMSADTV